MGRMTENEAREWIQGIQIAAQKARSIVGETLGAAGEVERGVYAELSPHVIGKRSGINLVELADLLLSRERLTPGDFYNLMFLADREVLVGAQLALNCMTLPKPDLAWLRGWAPEEAEDGSG